MSSSPYTCTNAYLDACICAFLGHESPLCELLADDEICPYWHDYYNQPPYHTTIRLTLATIRRNRRIARLRGLLYVTAALTPACLAALFIALAYRAPF